MYLGGGVTAVVDWELAHLGDPMDDIAWLSLRATQEPLPDFPTRLREYEELSGNPIDDARVRYYRVMAETKLQVMSHRGPRSGGDASDNGDGGGNDVGNGFIYQVLHRRLWLEALASANGLELVPAEEPQAPRSSGQRLDVRRRPHSVARRHCAADDGSACAGSGKGRGPHRQVPGSSRYLYGPSLRGLRTAGPGDVAWPAPRLGAAGPGGCRCGCCGSHLAAGLHPHSVAPIARETELARPSMGVLADRHWPPLR